MKKNNKKFAVGAAIAAAAGYVAGILTAPKSGKETRKDIQNAGVKVKTETEKKLKELHGELDKLIEQGKVRAGDAKDTAKTELKKALLSAQTAKDKARQVLSAIHEGDAEDADLKSALKEAKQAVSDLKVYLKK